MLRANSGIPVGAFGHCRSYPALFSPSPPSSYGLCREERPVWSTLKSGTPSCHLAYDFQLQLASNSVAAAELSTLGTDRDYCALPVYTMKMKVGFGLKDKIEFYAIVKFSLSS